jgi:hypothetical protein
LSFVFIGGMGCSSRFFEGCFLFASLFFSRVPLQFFGSLVFGRSLQRTRQGHGGSFQGAISRLVDFAVYANVVVDDVGPRYTLHVVGHVLFETVARQTERSRQGKVGDLSRRHEIISARKSNIKCTLYLWRCSELQPSSKCVGYLDLSYLNVSRLDDLYWFVNLDVLEGHTHVSVLTYRSN